MPAQQHRGAEKAMDNLVKRETQQRLNMEPNSALTAVVDVLTDVDKYLDWSRQVKKYLTDHKLWDIVEATGELPRDEAASVAWTDKNAKALRVIHVYCGSHLCSAIRMITSAKIAWDTLAAICNFPKHCYIVTEDESYVTWSCRMKAYLKINDLWDMVEATTEPPTPEDDEISFNAWSKKNALAFYLIGESSRAFYLIDTCRTAKVIWDTLEELLNPQSGMENNEAVSFQNDLREGNWTAVNQYIRSKQEGEAVSAKFSYARRTALHIAVLAGKINIVKELVKIMPKESLLMKDKDGVTVLGSCAIVGNIKMAKCIIEKSQNLLSIENGKDELIPVVLALTCNPDTIEMARYLYDKTPKEDLMPGRGVNGATFITRCIYAKAFYMASTLLKCYPTLATALDIKKESPVFALATVSFAYPSGNQLIFWKQWIYNSICIPSVDATSELPISNKTLENGNIDQVRFPGSGHGFVLNLLKLLGINQICEMKLLHHQSRKLLLLMVKRLPGLSPQQLQNGLVTVAIIRAAKKGKVEFIASILEACPELVWYEEITSQRNLFMCAVLHRQSEVFGHLYGFLYKNSILPRGDSHNNSILHMAAMLEASTTGRNAVRGAAIHMQSELKWFKEVENIVHPSLLEAVNNEGQTPGELFTESHKDLVKAGEKWMKQRATSCTVVCALIVSIMFAAAITVPGGNDQNTGYPMFFKKKVFTLFITADALSLVSATTSLLMFLNILTSRYAEEDFLKSLPKKMMIGLSTLIFSTATMMITFCACLLIILHEKFRIVIPIICFASVPVTQFALMQFHLVNEMFISTYGSGILDKKVKPWS